jgi:hypothetical protein
MKINKEQLESVGLYQYTDNPYKFGDYEDIEFWQKTNELFYHSSIDETLNLYRKVKDFEDLKQALYDGFKIDVE